MIAKTRYEAAQRRRRRIISRTVLDRALQDARRDAPAEAAEPAK
ncbi:hypothetical protein [Actinomadura parmotrematis]|nr:hypothetical protein [Actinomadura parmotrematis]